MNNEEYGELLKGKRLIIIGRSTHLFFPKLDNQGKFIDSHDLVIRVNIQVPYSSEHSPRTKWSYFPHFVDKRFHHILGSRSNIYYLSCTWYPHVSSLLPAFINDGGIVVCSSEYNTSDYRTNIPIIESFCPYHEMDYSLWQEMCQEHNKIGYMLDSPKKDKGTNGPSGINAIKELIKFDFAELQLIGFTSYQNLPIDNEQYEKILQHDFHDPAVDFFWLQHLCETDARVRPDEILESMFIEKHDEYIKQRNAVEEYNQKKGSASA